MADRPYNPDAVRITRQPSASVQSTSMRPMPRPAGHRPYNPEAVNITASTERQPPSLSTPERNDTVSSVPLDDTPLPPAPELSVGGEIRDWQGQIASGALDAVGGALTGAASLGQGVLASILRSEPYPEGVIDPKAGVAANTIARIGHNATYNEAGEKRVLPDINRTIYDFDTGVGGVFANHGPVSWATRGVQWAMGDEGAGSQEFVRDQNADKGERGYVSPIKEYAVAGATVAIPTPATKFKLAGAAAEALGTPAALAFGAKVADTLFEWFVMPFSMPGTKGNMAINAGAEIGMDEYLRHVSGADTLSGQMRDYFDEQHPNYTTPQQKATAGVRSSGLSGYGGVLTDPAVTGIEP